MTIKFVIIGAIVITLLISSVSNTNASGIRYDTDAPEEEFGCWIDGYDSGFAGKYDEDRADECEGNIDRHNYTYTWDIGCKDSQRTEKECNELINNPVEIEDFEALEGENDRTCFDAGVEDGKTDKPFNKERSNGCYEFNGISYHGSGGYRDGYQFGCETHTAESTCELKHEDKKSYCPDHPDVVGCVDFLLNATNKMQYAYSLQENCALVNVTCFHEKNPEEYCLRYNDPFCKTIDICDNDGFVKPEYPYCTEQVK